MGTAALPLALMIPSRAVKVSFIPLGNKKKMPPSAIADAGDTRPPELQPWKRET
jgi:hypothetical protein